MSRCKTRLGGPVRAHAHASGRRRALPAVRARRRAGHLFGTSGGAVVGLALVTAYPVRLRALLAHEPPLVELLPDSAQVRAQIADTYDTYRSGGAGKAMGRFMVHAAWTMDPAGSRTPRWEPCA